MSAHHLRRKLQSARPRCSSALPPFARARWLRLSVKLHLGITEEDEVRRRDRDWTIDAEYRDLELVAGLDGFGEHDGARIAAAPRHLAVYPHLRIIVHIGREHRLGCGGVEVADLGRDRQGRAIPQ